jgi:predicted NBD/HSP70 family sugar kinase
VRVSHPYPTPDATVQFVNAAIGQVFDKLSPAHRSRIAGLGIALPFQLWDWAEPLGDGATEMRGWRDRDIAAEIASAWAFPVFVCNDASTACGAELVFGDQGKPRDFLYFFVGFFIGGGLVLGSTLYTGRTGNAAALGSMIVPTADGSLRQLVDVASLAKLERALVENGNEGAMIWDAPETWDVPHGPLEAWLGEASYGIAQAILSSVCLIDVAHVLIDGWMPAHMRAELVRRVQEDVSNISIAGVQKPEIFEGSIGPDARALGAASLPLSHRFLVEKDIYNHEGPAR